jgi:N-methylhydantoinase A/oxoprolinase/acetone carboxylase beta subunit
LSPQQQELFDRIKHKPIALQTLFKDQTLARALQRLEQRGVIIRSGFTPTDACHVLNLCKDGNAEASELGAKLLARFSGSNLGVSYADAHGVSSAICEQVSQLAAMAMLDSLSASRGQPLSRSQHELLKRSLDSQSDNLIVLTPSLQVPVIGLGAPVASFYPACGRLLNTPVILPEHGDVANALGAVVGSVRQEQVILITPSSGKKVRVMLPDGPQVVDSLEAGAALASEVATTLSVAKAHKAGSIDGAVVVERADKIVEQGGQSVFFESRITAIASGRPAVAQDQT